MLTVWSMVGAAQVLVEQSLTFSLLRQATRHARASPCPCVAIAHVTRHDTRRMSRRSTGSINQPLRIPLAAS